MPAGRPSKLTPEVQDKICKLLRDGNYYYTAALCSGISYASFGLWMDKGATQKSGKFFEFYKAVREAEAECEAELVEKWKGECPKDWNAARAFLERRQHTRWAKREKIEIEHGGKIETDSQQLKESLTQLLDTMAVRLEGEKKDVRQLNDADSKDGSGGKKEVPD